MAFIVPTQGPLGNNAFKSHVIDVNDLSQYRKGCRQTGLRRLLPPELDIFQIAVFYRDLSYFLYHYINIVAMKISCNRSYFFSVAPMTPKMTSLATASILIV